MARSAVVRPPHQRGDMGRDEHPSVEPDPSGRSELRGAPYEVQRDALRPPQRSPHRRLQADLERRSDARRPRASGAKQPPATRQRALLVAFNDAVSRSAAFGDLAYRALASVGQPHHAAGFERFVRELRGWSRVSVAAQALGHASTVLSLAEALSKGDLTRAGDLTASAVTTGLLSLNPFSAIPAVLLSVSYGTDWPTRLAHHLAGTHDTEAISGASYLHTPGG